MRRPIQRGRVTKPGIEFLDLRQIEEGQQVGYYLITAARVRVDYMVSDGLEAMKCRQMKGLVSD